MSVPVGSAGLSRKNLNENLYSSGFLLALALKSLQGEIFELTRVQVVERIEWPATALWTVFVFSTKIQQKNIFYGQDKRQTTFKGRHWWYESLFVDFWKQGEWGREGREELRRREASEGGSVKRGWWKDKNEEKERENEKKEAINLVLWEGSEGYWASSARPSWVDWCLCKEARKRTHTHTHISRYWDCCGGPVLSTYPQPHRSMINNQCESWGKP